MLRIERFSGTDMQLYGSVAPLVMSPEVLRQNNNYPFKTSEVYIWFVAFDDTAVVGFLPVEVKSKSAVINNYYVAGDDGLVLVSMLREVIKEFAGRFRLEAVVQTRHTADFSKCGFFTAREWKLYVKMEYRKK